MSLKTRECIGGHVVAGEDPDMLGFQTDDGFICYNCDARRQEAEARRAEAEEDDQFGSELDDETDEDPEGEEDEEDDDSPSSDDY